MKKLYVEVEELYPYYYAEDENTFVNSRIEVTEEEYEFIKKVKKDFKKAQDLLEEKYLKSISKTTKEETDED